MSWAVMSDIILPLGLLVPFSHLIGWCVFCVQVITRYLAGGMCGYDREGSPIFYDVIGPLDPKGLLMSASKQEFLKRKIHDSEILQRECRQQSEKVEHMILSPRSGAALVPLCFT